MLNSQTYHADITVIGNSEKMTPRRLLLKRRRINWKSKFPIQQKSGVRPLTTIKLIYKFRKVLNIQKCGNFVEKIKQERFVKLVLLSSLSQEIYFRQKFDVFFSAMTDNLDVSPQFHNKLDTIQIIQNKNQIVDDAKFLFNSFEKQLFETTASRSCCSNARDPSVAFQQQVHSFQSPERLTVRTQTAGDLIV